MNTVKLVVVGAGLIAKRHAEHIAAEPSVSLSAIVDPSPVGKALAGKLGTKWFRSFAEMIAAERPDGVVIATPNQLDLQNGLEAAAAGIPTIVGMPIADGVAAAQELVEAFEKASLPLHRRPSPALQPDDPEDEANRQGRPARPDPGPAWQLLADEAGRLFRDRLAA